MRDLFSLMFPDFKLSRSKPIRLFEAFSGIGTQHMALKRLGLNIELVGISEIDKFAIKSYEAIHGKVKNYGGIGSFDRFPKDIDICTWSFPCQDISLAGNQKGMEEGSRSNYGYIFLDTVENTPLKERPKVLIMENVRALFSAKFRDDWREIQLRLEKMGYKNYSNIMIATDYGIPQTRERVFIVSILGDYNYDFPKPIELKLRLKDFLEDEVDEKYYLSDKMIDYLTGINQKKSKYDRAAVFERNIYEDPNIAATITTRAGSRPTDNYIIEEDIEVVRKLYKEHGGKVFKDHILMPEATKRGFKEAYEGDGVYINRPHQKRGVVQTNKIQTIKTSVNDIGVVVKGNRKIYNPLKDKTPYSWHFEQEVYLDKGSVRTLKAGGGSGNIPKVIVKDNRNKKEHLADYLIEEGIVKGGEVINHSYASNRLNKQRRFVESDDGLMPTLTTRPDTLGVAVGTPLRIRKLTPLETWRLMGINDKDFHKAQAAGISDSQLYKQAGNAIVVDVLYYLFKQFIKGVRK